LNSSSRIADTNVGSTSVRQLFCWSRLFNCQSVTSPTRSSNDPQHDVFIGMLGSLSIMTILLWFIARSKVGPYATAACPPLRPGGATGAVARFESLEAQGKPVPNRAVRNSSCELRRGLVQRHDLDPNPL
jgi:hypothetical protein